MKVFFDRNGNINGSYNHAERFTSLLQDIGYDGVIVNNGEEYVTFSPNQIKSVYNRGTFSRENDNIYFSESGTREDGYKIADDSETVEAVRIPDNAVPDFKTKRELVSFIKDILGNERNITIKSTGDNVLVSNRGIERGASKSRSPEYNEAFGAVRQLLENAKYSGFEERDERHLNVRGQDIYHSALVIGNKPYSVMFKVDIPESEGTHNYAGHKISDIKIASTDNTGGRITIPANISSDAISKISLAVLRGKVNPARQKDDTLFYDARNLSGEERAKIYRWDKLNLRVGENLDFAGKAKDLQSIVNNLVSQIDIPVRKGKMFVNQSVRGFFKENSEIIRVRSHNDVSVVAHELGHGLEKRLWGKVGSAEITKYYDELKKIATKSHNDNNESLVSAEGFAEFISYFVVNPDYVKKETPEFYKYFNEIMPQKAKEVYDILLETQKDVRDYQEQPSLMRVKNMISVKETGERQTVKEMADKIYTNLVDDLHPLNIMEKEILKRSNASVDFDESPYILARNYRGVKEKANMFLQNAAFNTELEDVSESLSRIINDIPKKEEGDFISYLVAKRAIDINKRGIESGIATKDAEYIVESLEPKYAALAERLYAYQDALLKYAKDSGLLSRQQYEKFKEVDPHYVPFYRDINKGGTSAIGRKIAPSTVFLKLKGSDRNIINPLESIVKNTYNVIANSDKNMMLLKLADLTRFEGAGRYIEKVHNPIEEVKLPKGNLLIRPKEGENIGKNDVVLTDPDTGDALGIFTLGNDAFFREKGVNKNSEFSVKRNGEPETYEIAPDTARFINGLTNQQATQAVDFAYKLARIPASMLRAGATLTESFIERNALRDTLTAAINSKHGFKPVIDSFVGAYTLLFNKEMVAKWKKSGGALATLVATDRKSIQKNLKDLRDTGYVKRVWNRIIPNNWVDDLRIVSGFAEDMTRIGEFRKAYTDYLKQGKGNKAALIGAGFDAREVTLDFSRVGAATRGFNAITAFFNATVQGWDKFGRTVKERPLKASLMFGTLLAGSVYFLIANKDDKDIEDLNQTIKDSHWVFKSGDHIVKVPKPQEVAPFLALFERALTAKPRKGESWLDAYKGELEEIGSDFIHSQTSGLTPTAAVPFIEKKANKNLYFDTPLIPYELEKIAPEYQYTEYSSEVAKYIGNLLRNFTSPDNSYSSPIVIDNFIRAWTGGLGQALTKYADNILSDEEKQDIYAYEHTPFFRAFRVAHTKSSYQSYVKFMEKSKKLENLINTADLTLKRGEPDEKYMKYKKYESLLKLRKQILEIGKTQLAINKDKSMTIDDKRQLTETLIKKQIHISRYGLTLMDDVEF